MSFCIILRRIVVVPVLCIASSCVQTAVAQSFFEVTRLSVGSTTARQSQGGSWVQANLEWKGGQPSSVQGLQVEVSESLSSGSWRAADESSVIITPQGGQADVLSSISPGAIMCFFRVRLGARAAGLGELMALSAGSYSMGDGAVGGQPEEAPAHSVSLSAFAMGRTEVTWGQWHRVRAWAVVNGYPQLGGVGEGKGDFHPVHSVTWEQAVTWCHAASVMNGFQPCYDLATFACDFSKNGFRLPTEAEWEYGAKGGSVGQRFSWGSTITQTQANYHVLNSSTANAYSFDVNPTRSFPLALSSGTAPFTALVGSYPPNAFQLHDMLGNVAEWCQDVYSASYYGQSPTANPTGPATGTARVSRGGSWQGVALDLRVTARKPMLTNATHFGQGFRVVRRR